MNKKDLKYYYEDVYKFVNQIKYIFDDYGNDSNVYFTFTFVDDSVIDVSLNQKQTNFEVKEVYAVFVKKEALVDDFKFYIDHIIKTEDKIKFIKDIHCEYNKKIGEKE